MRSVLFALMILGFSPAHGAERVWLDYDLTWGKKIVEVDDGLSLISAATSTSLDLVGLSYGFGNTDNLAHMHEQTLRILRKINREDLNSYAGARSKSDLGKETAATQALAKALRTGPLKIMAIGRMTNVASTILLYPELKKNIQEVVVNFGRRLEYEVGVGRKKHIMPDTNVDDDLASVKVLIDAKVNLTLIPTELMFDQFIDKRRLRSLKQGGIISRWISREVKWWRKIWTIFPGTPGFIPWDVFVIGYLTNPEDFNCLEKIRISVKTLPNHSSRILPFRSRPPFKEFVVASHVLSEGVEGKYCYDVSDSHLDLWTEHWRNL